MKLKYSLPMLFLLFYLGGCATTPDNEIESHPVQVIEKSVSNELAATVDAPISEKTNCMVKLAKEQPKNYKAIITLVYAPQGIPLQTKKGRHYCLPYKSGAVDAAAMKGLTAVEKLAGTCGLNIEQEGAKELPIFMKTMLEEDPEFLKIFQLLSNAKKMCP